ncbi:M23 family metallopeptidase [Sphingomonas albertensis]|uniref:M23 family metallopeptidase n=1 Tax=Sphingomonas albertensis TaxID=2762591 RepID=A0ABR7AQV4_9SPHN|nr:M23 family metallopeptidase [Sphingomonas albertensis]MBC3942825.1 M23 family metallopeptidase [Sphingomonas albertensis]
MAVIRAAVLVLLAATSATAQQAPPPTTASQSAFRWTGTLSQGGLILGTAPAGTRSVALDGKSIALSPDGRFLAGFDRDAGPQASLTATLADGRSVTQNLTIAPRAWRIERLDTLPKFPAPDPVFAKLRQPELAQIVAARARSTDAQGWRQTFAWPATGRISGLFGSQRVYKGEPGSYHSGTDIAKPTGAIVTAPADGVVILAADRPFTLEGNLLMLDHGMGLNSAFLHLSRIDVKPGDHVRQGQPIGAVGMTGRATGPHLHWSLKWGDAKLDPMLVAGAMPGLAQSLHKN